MHLQPQCVSGLIRAIKNKDVRHREVPELSEADLTNVTHRKDRPLASGDRMRNSRHSNTIDQMSQDAGFSAEPGKSQYFVTRTSIKREGRWTLLCREHTLLRRKPDTKLVCVFCYNVRIDPMLDMKTRNLARLRSIQVLVP